MHTREAVVWPATRACGWWEGLAPEPGAEGSGKVLLAREGVSSPVWPPSRSVVDGKQLAVPPRESLLPLSAPGEQGASAARRARPAVGTQGPLAPGEPDATWLPSTPAADTSVRAGLL